MKHHLATLLVFCSLAIELTAQQNFDNVAIKTIHVAGPVHMLQGAGGNIGVSAGPDGVLIVDDQFAPLAEKIEAAIKQLNDGKIRFLLNTHWHGDHTGGNAHFGKQTEIVAHANVRKRLAEKSDTAKEALPVITFDHGISVHLNGEEVRVYHVGPGHTDGDSIVAFTKSKVVHMGDLYFKDRFPFIDLGSGGDVAGYVKNVAAALEYTPDDAKIIPGHGDLATKDDLKRYHTMLTTITGQVQRAITAGKSLDEVKAAGVPAEYKSWGAGFINESRFLEFCYNGLKAK